MWRHCSHDPEQPAKVSPPAQSEEVSFQAPAGGVLRTGSFFEPVRAFLSASAISFSMPRGSRESAVRGSSRVRLSRPSPGLLSAASMGGHAPRESADCMRLPVRRAGARCEFARPSWPPRNALPSPWCVTPAVLPRSAAVRSGGQPRHAPVWKASRSRPTHAVRASVRGSWASDGARSRVSNALHRGHARSLARLSYGFARTSYPARVA